MSGWFFFIWFWMTGQVSNRMTPDLAMSGNSFVSRRETPKPAEPGGYVATILPSWLRWPHSHECGNMGWHVSVMAREPVYLPNKRTISYFLVVSWLCRWSWFLLLVCLLLLSFVFAPLIFLS